MDERTKELIAIGASFAAHCQPCIAFHVDKAKKLGIESNEINDAIAVGRMIQKGAMSAMNKFVESMPDSSENKSSPCIEKGVSSCCR